MSKIALLAGMLCAVFAAPVLGVWEYQGTEVWISEPDSDADPYGTWWWGWDGEGDVDADPWHLYATGWTDGYSGVHLAPYWDSGLSRNAGAWSMVVGTSSYQWVPGGDKEIVFTFRFTMSTSGIDYYGYAVDDTHVSVLTSTSQVAAGAWGSEPNNLFWPYGSGYGWATTQSGAGTDNDSRIVTVTKDETDTWNPPPYLYNVGYEGELDFTCSKQIGPYADEPVGYTLEVQAVVYGSCSTTVDIEINDPFFYYLYAGAQASYSVTGQTMIDLEGNIQ